MWPLAATSAFLLFLSRKEVSNVLDGDIAEELLDAISLLGHLPFGLALLAICFRASAASSTLATVLCRSMM